MARISIAGALALVIIGCAGGKEDHPVDGYALDHSIATDRLIAEGTPAVDTTQSKDGASLFDSCPADGSKDQAHLLDATIEDSQPGQDKGPEDGGIHPDAGSCVDNYEPNNSCLELKHLGEALEDSGWMTKQASIENKQDSDWYSATGQEIPHTCFPFTPQCLMLKVQLDIPSGRPLRVCLYKESCSVVPICSTSTVGAKVLEVQYKVDGTCAVTDDTSARIMVELVSGAEFCTSYSISFRYDNCG